MATVTELVTKFSFQGSSAPLSKYNATLGKGIGLLAGFATTTAAATAAFAKWTSGVLAAEQPLINLSSQTGIAVETIQELGYVASVSNSSIGAMNSTLEGLSEKIGEAAQKGSEDFSRLGISVRDANGNIKNANTLLLEVGQRFRQLNLSMSEQQSFAEALGIDPSLLTLLNRSSSEIRNLRAEARELGILTKEQTEQAMEYNDSMTRMNTVMDSVRRLAAVGLAPQMEELTKRFTTLIKENKDWVIDGIQASSKGLMNLMDAFKRLAPFMAVLIASFVTAKVATLGFSGALGVLFSPAVLIAAGIAGILLVLDDLIVAFRGGKSVIRDFFLEFFNFDIQPVLVGIVDGFMQLFETLKGLANGWLAALGGIFSGIGSILKGNFMQGLDDLNEAYFIWIDSLAEAFKDMFGGVFDWLRDKISGLIPDWLVDFIRIDVALPDPSMRPGGGNQVSNQTSNRTEVNVQQNIRTNDPERAGRVAADSLQRQLEDTQTQTNRGGM
jgi:hypothetical protein